MAVSDEAMVEASVALDEHLLSVHDVGFAVASEESRRWLLDAMRMLSGRANNGG